MNACSLSSDTVGTVVDAIGTAAAAAAPQRCKQQHYACFSRVKVSQFVMNACSLSSDTVGAVVYAIGTAAAAAAAQRRKQRHHACFSWVKVSQCCICHHQQCSSGGSSTEVQAAALCMF
jgi:translation initiation factor 2B subunit (eIF-2B alpha/beta/delta family)